MPIDVVDSPVSVQAAFATAGSQAVIRLTGGLDAYLNDANRKYLMDVGMMNYTQAAAARVHEESGSGRVRDLGVRPTT